MRILVTGARGFLGSNLMPRLRDAYPEGEVIPVYRNEHYRTCWDTRSKWVNCNLLNKVDVDLMMGYLKPTVVIHAAGSVGGIGANQKNPGKFIYENLQMGVNMIDAARRWYTRKFVLLGTVCSYPKYTSVPFCENDLWNGYPEETNAPYGIAKKTLIEMLHAYRKQYELNSVCLLPANMYGPHDHFNLEDSHVIPAIILKINEAICKNLPSVMLWGSGRATREFLYVDDCCDAIILAIKSDKNIIGEMNIGTGKEICIHDLAISIAGIMGYRGELFFDPDKPDGQPRRCLDVSRSKFGLGFEAKTDLLSGLAQTIKWFQENLV